ncbi:flagellar basal body-associated FliL family protein [Pacificibacter marinus]|uniref:Flagellar protein FliL n=1 Tax=Pacificibacter marinus TaxID=658057 RepID=A0A1Y5T0W5_9RHOB|nr:flagellar basal body-associated FliL family protein [Pacificibacter marinus]SEL05317.1 hypothetical protein SAMN04488032_110111 [Pacificibacter marinus]SLN51533.1 Flagellar basal body-associated protein FliL [Pacificibacter marinus]
MLKKILPILLALIGLGAGIGGGIVLRPDQEIVVIDPCGDVPAHDTHEAEVLEEGDDDASSEFEYVKLNNQFVVPDLDDGRVAAMVVLSLSLEAKTGAREAIYAREPKLRDAFLQVLFDHANTGGFKGAFTDSGTMNTLRTALTEIAQKTIGNQINDVLVIDIVRQDVK